MEDKELTIVESIEDANCINCLNSKQIGDEHYCYYPRDPDERHEVGERDFCEEAGTWLVMDNTRLKTMDHEDIVVRFGELPFDPIVTSTLQPQVFDTANLEDGRC